MLIIRYLRSDGVGDGVRIVGIILGSGRIVTIISLRELWKRGKNNQIMPSLSCEKGSAGVVVWRILTVKGTSSDGNLANLCIAQRFRQGSLYQFSFSNIDHGKIMQKIRRYSTLFLSVRPLHPKLCVQGYIYDPLTTTITVTRERSSCDKQPYFGNLVIVAAWRKEKKEAMM